MKIAIVSAYYHPVTGGAENHMRFIAEELVRRGHEVDVYVSDSNRGREIRDKFEIYNGVKIYRLNTWFKISLSGVFFPGIFKAIRKSGADIINVHGFRHPFSFVNFFTKKPCAITLHWPVYYGLRAKWLDFLVKIFDRFFGGFLLKRYDRVFAVSGAEIPWIRQFGINEDKIGLTPNGIPKNYLKKRNGTKFRKKLGIKKELMVLCLSRIHKTKGFDQVIKVAKCFPDVKFVIAGIDGGFKDYLEKLSSSLDNVIFAGELTEEEKLEAYAAADIFVHPSHYEAFGIVVLEAFSQGCAVITSDNGGMPWVVGDCGLIFKDYDLLDLKEKLGSLIKDKKLRKELSNRGKKKVKDFTWEKIVDGIEQKYARLL